MSRAARLAEFFREHPNEWIAAIDLEFAGRQAWRSRLAELRFAPFHMAIENRVRVLANRSKRSEYKFVPQPSQAQAPLPWEAR